MSGSETLVAVLIHLVVPAAGIAWYLRVFGGMRKVGVSKDLITQMFLVFATYGTLLVLLLTTFFWQWSGLASIGVFYLILGAPIVMGIIALMNYSTRKGTKYDKWLFWAGALYFVILPVCIAFVESAF